MIIREKNGFIANHDAGTSLNEVAGINQNKIYDESLLGLTFSNHLENHIPNRFIWEVSMIKLVD
ncbi:MAG: hypothetical protein R2764_24845 [Bacteroidales bacterium]